MLPPSSFYDKPPDLDGERGRMTVRNEQRSPSPRPGQGPAWLPRPGMILRALLPSFVADVAWPEHHHRTPQSKLHPTSYLDGLRGIAAFVVFICHYTEDNHPYLVPSYGLNPETQVSSWLQLPFVRIVFSGRPMVHIFFVISGFVLSHKPLKAIHARDMEKCHAALSSSAFRRPIRLFAPCAVSTFLIALIVQTGFYYPPAPSLSVQLWMWKDAMFHSITWPWAWDFDLRPGFDVHLWTIPIEFAHSMLLFLVILLLSRVRLRVRQAGNFALMIYCLCCGKWAGFEFLSGMFLADIHILQSGTKGPRAHDHPSASHRMLLPVARSAFHCSVILTAVFVGGWPNFDAEKTPGIRYLLARTPSPFAEMDILAPQKFWFAVSAVFVIWSSGELGWLRRFLEGPFAQYCGRLSYAIYIVHGPVLGMFAPKTIGLPFIPERGVPGQPDHMAAVAGTGVKGMFGIEGPFQRMVCWLAGLFILAPIAVWTADLFWRLVDVPIIAWARKIENLCLDEPAGPSMPPPSRSREGQTYPMSSVVSSS